MKDVEIEIKLPLLNKAVVVKFLNDHSSIASESTQHDIYFNAPHRDFLENKDNVNEWLRIRVSGNKAQINYKDWQPHEEPIKTHCTELETSVDSFDQLDKILGALNFKKLIEVNKLRRSWIYKDIEISIDTVKGLGDYIELEYKGKINNIDEARKHLFAVLKEIKAKTKELDVKGYPYLLLKSKKLI